LPSVPDILVDYGRTLISRENRDGASLVLPLLPKLVGALGTQRVFQHFKQLLSTCDIDRRRCLLLMIYGEFVGADRRCVQQCARSSVIPFSDCVGKSFLAFVSPWPFNLTHGSVSSARNASFDIRVAIVHPFADLLLTYSLLSSCPRP